MEWFFSCGTLRRRVHAGFAMENWFRIIFVAAPSFLQHYSSPQGVCALLFHLFAAERHRGRPAAGSEPLQGYCGCAGCGGVLRCRVRLVRDYMAFQQGL